MAEGIINKGLKTVKNKGIIYTISRTLVYIARYISYLWREYSSYVLSVFLGHELAWKICLVVFKFRCKHGLLGGGKSLWVAKSLRSCAYKTVYMNPTEIKHVIRGGIVPYIQDGDWDLSKEEYTLHETVRELFVEKVPASETKQYKMMKEAIVNKDWEMSRDCRNQSDLDAYFRTFEDIYHDFSRSRYRRQSEVKQAYMDRRPKYYPNEILLSIDRNGNYLLESGGTHRLSIARLLGIKTVPAVIIRKHYQYVKSKENWFD